MRALFWGHYERLMLAVFLLVVGGLVWLVAPPATAQPGTARNSRPTLRS